MSRLAMAIATSRTMSDGEMRDAVFGGGYAWLLAAITTGRRTPPDLAGRRSAYVIPRTLPWWPRREVTREARLRRLLEGLSGVSREVTWTVAS